MINFGHCDPHSELLGLGSFQPDWRRLGIPQGFMEHPPSLVETEERRMQGICDGIVEQLLAQLVRERGVVK